MASCEPRVSKDLSNRQTLRRVHLEDIFEQISCIWGECEQRAIAHNEALTIGEPLWIFENSLDNLFSHDPFVIVVKWECSR